MHVSHAKLQSRPRLTLSAARRFALEGKPVQPGLQTISVTHGSAKSASALSLMTQTPLSELNGYGHSYWHMGPANPMLQSQVTVEPSKPKPSVAPAKFLLPCEP